MIQLSNSKDCGNLEKKIKSLEIDKDEQCNCHNCIEFSSIPNTINDDKLEDTIIEVCKDVNIVVSKTGAQRLVTDYP